MRLLFVHEVNWAEKVRYEIHELPELLSLRGHHVEFIDFPEQRDKTRRFKRLDLKTVERTYYSWTYRGSKVRITSPCRIVPAPIDRLIATFTFVPTLFSKLRKDEYDAIILYSVPTNGWQTIIVARLMGVPVVFRALDVSHLIRKTRLKRLVLAAERFVYRRANWLSANNSELLAYCLKNGAHPSTSSVDYPGLDVAHFQRESPSSTLRRRLNISEKDKVLIFLGTLFTFCGLDRVLLDLCQEHAKDLNVRLLILGDGEMLNELKKFVNSNQLESKVSLMGRVDFAQLGDYLSLGDVAMMTFKAETVAELALPWKVFQYIAAGLPVVASPLRGLMSALPPGVGILYLDPTENSVVKMHDLACNDEKRRELIEQGLSTVKEKFLWELNVVHFEKLFERVAQEFKVSRTSQ